MYSIVHCCNDPCIVDHGSMLEACVAHARCMYRKYDARCMVISGVLHAAFKRVACRVQACCMRAQTMYCQ